MPLASAETCKARMGSYYFYMAMLDADGVFCGYQDCYYTCRYSDYRIPGKFNTANFSWVKQNDNRYRCYSIHPEDCRFQ
jgi:hypothetical protein